MNVLIAYLLVSALAAWFCCALSSRRRREEDAPATLRLVYARAPRRAGRR